MFGSRLEFPNESWFALPNRLQSRKTRNLIKEMLMLLWFVYQEHFIICPKKIFFYLDYINELNYVKRYMFVMKRLNNEVQPLVYGIILLQEQAHQEVFPDMLDQRRLELNHHFFLQPLIK